MIKELILDILAFTLIPLITYKLTKLVFELYLFSIKNDTYAICIDVRCGCGQQHYLASLGHNGFDVTTDNDEEHPLLRMGYKESYVTKKILKDMLYYNMDKPYKLKIVKIK